MLTGALITAHFRSSRFPQASSGWPPQKYLLSMRRNNLGGPVILLMDQWTKNLYAWLSTICYLKQKNTPFKWQWFLASSQIHNLNQALAKRPCLKSEFISLKMTFEKNTTPCWSLRHLNGVYRCIMNERADILLEAWTKKLCSSLGRPTGLPPKKGMLFWHRIWDPFCTILGCFIIYIYIYQIWINLGAVDQIQLQ